MRPRMTARWLSIVVALTATAGVSLAPASSLGQQPEQPTPRSREEAAAARVEQREQAIAIVNLRAAEMPGLAEEVQREVDRLEREWNKQQPQPAPEGRSPSRDANAGRQLNELRAEIESLRRELESLRRDFHGRKPGEPQHGSDDTPWWMR